MIFHQILQDVGDVTKYIPQGLIAGIIYMVFELMVRLMMGVDEKNWDSNVLKSFLKIFAVTYLTVVFETAFFSREPGSRTGVDLIPFETISADIKANIYVVENIIFFIPAGILIPIVWSKIQKYTILLCFLLSLSIEVSQLVAHRGYCQFDDLIMNTFGGAIGYFVFVISQHG